MQSARTPLWRAALTRITPLMALHGSLRAAPTTRDGLVFALYRGLVWLVNGTRFWRPLNVATRGLSRRLTLTVSLNGPSGRPVRLTLPLEPQTYWTLYEIFFAHAYRPVAPVAPAVVVDAGANIGLASVYLHALYPGARFLCVEADPANLTSLRRNLRLNGINFEIVPAALGRVEGDVTFRAHRAASDYSSTRCTSFRDSEYREITVRATTLGALLATYGVSRVGLLKIDIEGSEFDVLSSGGDVLRRLDYITGEFHGFAGDVTALLEGVCRATGLTVLAHRGSAALATVHLGPPQA
ncbi:MAG TPA: FkbM family methyltransferase [Gemmatimonadales bacterium]|nr:FkbM family methyltransferase [Gemmatimonadales bacterium]